MWLTSDQHFGHQYISEYCGRPFHYIHEMEEALVNNHNSVVSIHDTVYHLGDFALVPNIREVSRIVKRLNGKHILLRGNHDRFSCKKYMEAGFEDVVPKRMFIPMQGKLKCLLGHDLTNITPDQKRDISIVFHGHTHNANNGRFIRPDLPVIPSIQGEGIFYWNVCVENNKYTPVDFGRCVSIILDLIEKRS